jgi:D-alanyl-D-alanine dipeptidase
MSTLIISCKTYQLKSSKIDSLKDIQLEKDDNLFVNLKDYSDQFVYDMKYASTDNFLNQKVYPCDECYLRVKTIKALITANNEFLENGYRIKIFDCYRPKSIQKKMWSIFPDANYVANPKKGSIHNKGGAVDVSLVDLKGNELQMGTNFDHFDKEAWHDYTNLPQEILNNRKFLKSIMEKHQFVALKSEWWHYNYSQSTNDKVEDLKWDCN